MHIRTSYMRMGRMSAADKANAAGDKDDADMEFMQEGNQFDALGPPPQSSHTDRKQLGIVLPFRGIGRKPFSEFLFAQTGSHILHLAILLGHLPTPRCGQSGKLGILSFLKTGMRTCAVQICVTQPFHRVQFSSVPLIPGPFAQRASCLRRSRPNRHIIQTSGVHTVRSLWFRFPFLSEPAFRRQASPRSGLITSSRFEGQ